MVSRYGVSKEGAVGVAVGVGPMHCLLPHCGGPHHHHHLSAPHPQNPQPGHNHHVHPAHQPPPSPSPHLNHQLSHHQLTVNINHLSHQQQQQQQTQHQQAPPQYRVVTANARSDFHVSGQNYGTQPGGQVGGGGGSVGVPGGRGPPPLGGLQSIGQSAAGIPPGGPAGGQAPPQTPAPGVQSQPPQGPAPTTTPPVHTPSPQEMGKQAHMQPQPQPLSQVYGPTQTRPSSQGYYQGPRPQQPRGISHRGGQGGTSAQVVGMSGVGGSGGQPTAIYHTSGLPVQTGAIYQVPHQIPHQQSLYTMNNQMPLQFGAPPQRHPTHQNQSYFQPFQHNAILTQSMFGYGAPAPTPQPYYWPTGQPNTPLSLSRAGASAVTGGAQHVAGPLAGAQGAPVVPQGTLQQPTQQAQPLPPMGISLSQTDMYSGHNGGATSASNSTTKSRKPRGQNAITDIVDPTTGKNISHEIYKDNETIQSGESSNRDTPQPQNNDVEVQADFAARVAKTLVKVATEESNSDSTVPTCVPNTSTSQNVTQSLSNSQTNSTNDVNNQCSTSSPTTQNVPNVTALCSQSLGTTSNVSQIDSCAMKTESKPLQIPVKEFQPRSDSKSGVIEELPLAISRNVNKDDISAQLPAMIVTEVEVKSTSATSIVTQTSVPIVTIPSTNVPEVPKPSTTAPSANPVPAREPFPNLSNKNSSSSPPRRKSQTHTHNQSTATATISAAATEFPSSAKEQKDKKTREKSLSSRGTTPTPAHNQTDHHLKTNGDASGDKPESDPVRTEIQQQKSSDGKAMQKQKSKNRLKPRELNRKGAEKEGTDMDAFVNTVPPAKPEIKQDNKDPLTPKDSNKEGNREIIKDNKDKDNYEPKKEKETSSDHIKERAEKQTPVSPDSLKQSFLIETPAIEKLPSNKETIKESSSKTDDNKTSNACNMQSKSVPNDVVDHVKVKEESDVQAIVAQKNEENSKVSSFRTVNEDKPQTSPVIEKTTESEAPVQTEITSVTNQIQLKYKYKEDQWSPINKSGKKIYDREFLIKLQDDPNSKIKPSNLPDLDVVLKDSSKARNNVELRLFKDTNINRHDVLFPGFIKPLNANNRALPPNRKSNPGKSSKPTKPNVIHVSLSLREDVKLRETENAWRPTRLKSLNLSEEEAKSEALYKRVRSVLNKLTPQKFNTLVDQVRTLTIDTPERLQGVINLVFEKAVDEPSFSVAYALMCKELAVMEVSGSDKNSDKQECSYTFKKLIINRCQKEFERNPVNEVARAAKLKEIEECTDPEKKKDLQLQFEDEERKTRIKSVGNIRFIGELYKQGMLTTKIMHRCTKELLIQSDEDSLECLCKLLTTVGKDLESKVSAEEMQDYFNKMQDIVARRGHGKISSRIRFMLQDVIDLRANSWIPRRDDSNPKTIDQIQKEADSERLDSQLSNTPLSTPRKDERTSDRKRNRGVGPTDDGGWSQPVVRTRQPYSVETAKLKNKPPPMDDLQLGSRNMYMWKTPSSCGSKAINSNKFACLENVSNLDQDKRKTSPQLSGSRSTGPREYGRDYKPSYDGRSSRNGSHQLSSSSSSRDNSLLDNSQGQSVSMPPPSLKSSTQSTSSSHKPQMSEEEFMKTLNKIMKDYLKNPIIEKVSLAIQQNFDNTLTKFVRELINFVLEKSPLDRECISYLLSHLITQKILPISHLRNGFIEILELVDDLVLDIPKVWLYLAEILSHPIEEEIVPLTELKPIFDSLRTRGYVGKFLGELLSKISRDKGHKWIADKWDQSGLKLSNVIDTELEEVDKIIKDYNLEFCTGDYNSAKSSTSNQPTMQQIHDELRRLMKESSFDEICGWIIVHVGNRVKEPSFIRILTTAILETSMEPVNSRWCLNSEAFINLQQLIRRFVDANESLELQCLYAIQLHLHNLQYPHGTLFNIMTNLSDYNIISSDAFLTWKKSPEPAQREWHGVATMALTSFFTGLQEADDASSVEDVSTSVSQERC
ncbi:eukaryotic translation initiation factor 4 gamma 3 isoform X2 [Bombus impatiens]|uniref:Eukaryotic translation initiation factor 4 gamma 3 isoform X2 n=1 Tax=Bombus impatiens TaxID=132113 RepID=A0A6P6FKL1_BOMIM|nr:eukaryotic translation initiation factor 4 gamma 3 isoform X2 [Bombus impatiens]